MDKDYSVFVNAAAIVLVPATVGRTEVDDLMNSVLLAQLVADKRLQRTPTADWYGTYRDVLSTIWVASAKERQDLLPKKDSTGSPLEWMQAIPLDERADQQQQIVAVLERVAALAGSLPAMGILRKHAQTHDEPDATQDPSASRAVRLLVIVAQSPVSMASLHLQFNTASALGANPWGQRFDGRDIEGCVSARHFQLHLSETLFAPAREAIARKVRAVVADNVADITRAIEDSVPAEEVDR